VDAMTDPSILDKLLPEASVYCFSTYVRFLLLDRCAGSDVVYVRSGLAVGLAQVVRSLLSFPFSPKLTFALSTSPSISSCPSSQFYAVRVWVLSGKTNHILFGVLLLLAAGGFACEIALGIFDLTHSSAADIVKAECVFSSPPLAIV
jgi:hypothetical protein